jgi:Domain of unknown function (DUF4926)
MKFKQYDVIKILDILNPEKQKGCGSGLGYGAPKIGDIGTIVEIYTDPSLGYDIECCDEQGATKWLTIFEPSEIKMELVWENNL